MGKRGETRPEKVLDLLIRGGLVLILVLAPLPFASVQPWAYWTLELAVSVVALLYLYRLFLYPSSTRADFSPLLLPGVSLLVITGLQLVPLPPMLIRWISP